VVSITVTRLSIKIGMFSIDPLEYLYLSLVLVCGFFAEIDRAEGPVLYLANPCYSLGRGAEVASDDCRRPSILPIGCSVWDNFTDAPAVNHTAARLWQHGKDD
jgi:hypothetical protein